MHTARLSQFQCMLGSHPPLPSACWEANPVYVEKPTPFPMHAGKPPFPVHTVKPPPLWTEWHTGVKTLPCPKLLLRAVNICKLNPLLPYRTKNIIWHFTPKHLTVLLQPKTYCFLPKLLIIKGLYSWILCGPQHIFDLLENADWVELWLLGTKPKSWP